MTPLITVTKLWEVRCEACVETLDFVATKDDAVALAKRHRDDAHDGQAKIGTGGGMTSGQG